MKPWLVPTPMCHYESDHGSCIAELSIVRFCDTQVDSPTKSLGTLARTGVLSVENVGLPMLGSLNATSAAMAGGLSEGSWNAAWDVRPARWLHGRHSAWLLFGVCACFSAAAAPLISAATSPLLIEDVVDSLPAPSTALAELENEPVEPAPAAPQTEQSGHGKEIITDYTVTGKTSWIFTVQH